MPAWRCSLRISIGLEGIPHPTSGWTPSSMRRHGTIDAPVLYLPNRHTYPSNPKTQVKKSVFKMPGSLIASGYSLFKLWRLTQEIVAKLFPVNLRLGLFSGRDGNEWDSFEEKYWTTRQMRKQEESMGYEADSIMSLMLDRVGVLKVEKWTTKVTWIFGFFFFTIWLLYNMSQNTTGCNQRNTLCVTLVVSDIMLLKKTLNSGIKKCFILEGDRLWRAGIYCFIGRSWSSYAY